MGSEGGWEETINELECIQWGGEGLGGVRERLEEVDGRKEDLLILATTNSFKVGSRH